MTKSEYDKKEDDKKERRPTIIYMRRGQENVTKLALPDWLNISSFFCIGVLYV